MTEALVIAAVAFLVVFVVAVIVLWVLGAWRAKPPPVATLESREPREAVRHSIESPPFWRRGL
jgi:uncharacterized protein (DUF58 family)